MRLGPEWRGKLPPGAQEQLDRTLAGWRESGLVTHVEVDGPGDCPVSEAITGVLFPLGAPPSVPIEGCERLPCCACGYRCVLNDEGGAEAQDAQGTGTLMSPVPMIE